MSGWLVFGGTSVSAPSLAGIINSAGANWGSQELATIYGSVFSNGTINSSNFFDIVAGTAGGFSTTAGWDFVTGIGSTNGMSGK